MRIKLLLTFGISFLSLLCSSENFASVIATTGTVIFEENPHPNESNSSIFVFNEKQSIAFHENQNLNFGSIAAGTKVDSHYVIYDPLSVTGQIGSGSITFSGNIVGVITANEYLDAILDVQTGETSDSYFGLSNDIGPYTATGTNYRGLGSPDDNLKVNLGTKTLNISSLEILYSGASDGFRVLTTSAVPEPTSMALIFMSLFGLAIRKRYAT